MKKEIISFVIGAGIVGSIWCCKTFCESKPEAASVAVAPEPQKNDVKNQQSTFHLRSLRDCQFCRRYYRYFCAIQDKI